MIYLASPYSHKDPLVQHERFTKARQYVVRNLEGEMVFSPILYFHEMAQVFSLPTDFEFYQRINHEMIDLAKEVRVLRLEGWGESKGVQDEIEYASQTGIPVTFVSL